MIFPYDLSYRPQSQSVVIIKNFINIREGKMKKNYNIDFSLSFIIKIKKNFFSNIRNNLQMNYSLKFSMKKKLIV